MLATLFYDDVEADTILQVPVSTDKRNIRKNNLFPSESNFVLEGQEEGRGGKGIRNDHEVFSPSFSSLTSSSVLHGSIDLPDLDACVYWWTNPHHKWMVHLFAVNNYKAVGVGHQSDCCLLPIDLPIAPNANLLTCGITRQGFGRQCLSVVWVTTSLEVGMIGLVVQREQGVGGIGGGQTFTTSIASPTSLPSAFSSLKSTGVLGPDGAGGSSVGSGVRSPTEITHPGSPFGASSTGFGGSGVSSWRSMSGGVVGAGGYGKLFLQVDPNRCISGVLLTEIRNIFASEAAQKPAEDQGEGNSRRMEGIEEEQLLSGCILSEVPPSTFQDGGGWRAEEIEISAVMLFTNGQSIWRVFLYPNGTVAHHAFVDNKRVSRSLQGVGEVGEEPGPEREGLFRFLDDRDLVQLPNLQKWRSLQELVRTKHPDISSSWKTFFSGGSALELAGQSRRGVLPSSKSSSRWWSGFFTGRSRCHVEGTTTTATGFLPVRRYLCISAVQESPGWFVLLRWDGLLEFYDGLSEEINPLWSSSPTCYVPHVSDTVRLGKEASGTLSLPTTTTNSSFASFLQWAKFTPSTQKIDVVTIATTTRRRSKIGSSRIMLPESDKNLNLSTDTGEGGDSHEINPLFSSSSSFPQGQYRVVYRKEKEEDEDEEKKEKNIKVSQQVLWTCAPTNLPFSSEERIALRNSVALTSPFPGGVFRGCCTSHEISHQESEMINGTTGTPSMTTGSSVTKGGTSTHPQVQVVVKSRLFALWMASPLYSPIPSVEEGVGCGVRMEERGAGTLHLFSSFSNSSFIQREENKNDLPRRSIASLLQSSSVDGPFSSEQREGRDGGEWHYPSLLQTVDTVELIEDSDLGGSDGSSNNLHESENLRGSREEGVVLEGGVGNDGPGVGAIAPSVSPSLGMLRARRGAEIEVRGGRTYRVDGGTLTAILTPEGGGMTVAVETYMDYHRLHVVEDRSRDVTKESGGTTQCRCRLDDLLEKVTLPIPQNRRGRFSPSRKVFNREEDKKGGGVEEQRRTMEPNKCADSRRFDCFPSKGFRSLHLTPYDDTEEGIHWEEMKHWLQELIHEGGSSEEEQRKASQENPFYFVSDEDEMNAVVIFSAIIDGLERHPDGAGLLLRFLRGVLDREPCPTQNINSFSSPLVGFGDTSELMLDPFGMKYCLTPSRVERALDYALTYDIRWRFSVSSSSTSSCFAFSRYYIASSISRHLLHRLVFVACLFLGWTSKRTSEEMMINKEEDFSGNPPTDQVCIRLWLGIEYLSAAFFTAQAAGADLVTFGAHMMPRLLSAASAASVPLHTFGTGSASLTRSGPMGANLFLDAALFAFLSPDIFREGSNCLIERSLSIACGFYNASSYVSSFSSRSGITNSSCGGGQAALIWSMNMGDRVPLLQHLILLHDLEAGRTRCTSESLMPRCLEVMKALSALLLPLPTSSSSSSPSEPASSSSSSRSAGCSGTEVLLEMGFLLTDPVGSTLFSGMRLNVLHFLLERHPELCSRWYAVGLLRRLVAPRGGGVLLASASSIRSFFLVELLKLRDVVEVEMQPWLPSSTETCPTVTNSSCTEGAGLTSSMWSSVWGALLELHLDTLLALSWSARQEGELFHAFHHLENGYRMLSNSLHIFPVGAASAADENKQGTTGVTTTKDRNSKKIPFFQHYLSNLHRVVTLLMRSVGHSCSEVRLLPELPSLSPVLEEWMVQEWLKTILEISDDEASTSLLREESVYALHRFLLQRHAYGECGRVLSDLATSLRRSGCPTPLQSTRIALIARLTALSLNAVEMISRKGMGLQDPKFPFSKYGTELKRSRSWGEIESADADVSENRTAITLRSEEAGNIEHTPAAGVSETWRFAFPASSSTLAARALSRKDLPWLRLRVHLAYCELILCYCLPCGQEGMESGNPSPSPVVSSTTEGQWTDLWVENTSAPILYKAASQLFNALEANLHWTEAFRFAVLLKAEVKRRRLGRGKFNEEVNASIFSSSPDLEASVDPCRVLQRWTANLVGRSATHCYFHHHHQYCRSHLCTRTGRETCGSLPLDFSDEAEDDGNAELEEEWDALLLGCAECSSLANQFYGFSIVLITALTENYAYTPKRLLEAYQLVDPYGALKSLLMVQQIFRQEADSSRSIYLARHGNQERLICVACIDAAYIAMRVLKETSISPSSSFCFTAGVFDTLTREIQYLQMTCPDVLQETDEENMTTQFLEHFKEVLSSDALL